MKKLLQTGVIILLVILMLVAAGCGSKTSSGDKDKSAPQTTSQGTPPATSQPAPQPQPAAQKKVISIATGPVGGSYYPIGVGMAEVIKKYLGIEANVIVAGGGAENPKLVGEGENDLGISNSNYIFDAFKGQSGYKGYPDLRILFSGVAPGATQMVVKADSPIKSYADLKGKRVAVGPQGSGSAPNLEKLFEFYGMKLTDIKPSFMGYDDGFTALQNGQVDAAVNTSPLPTSGVTSLSASGFKFRILGIEEDKLASFTSKYPYYGKLVIPKDTYKLDSDVTVFGTTNMAIVNGKLNDDLVYNITKAMFEHIDVIAQSHPSAKSLTLQKAVQGAPIPYHSGAEKYFKETGAMK